MFKKIIILLCFFHLNIESSPFPKTIPVGGVYTPQILNDTARNGNLISNHVYWKANGRSRRQLVSIVLQNESDAEYLRNSVIDATRRHLREMDAGRNSRY